MSLIQIDNMNYGALVCPSCGGSNLHHEAVHVWSRHGEDATKGTYVRADGKSSCVESDAPMDGNPSRRRDGLTIEFSCEACSGAPVGASRNPSDEPQKHCLHIVQHKGTTYLSWNSFPV